MVNRSTTALALHGTYEIIVRFPENLNTEELSCLALFGCISGGISVLLMCRVPKTVVCSNNNSSARVTEMKKLLQTIYFFHFQAKV